MSFAEEQSTNKIPVDPRPAQINETIRNIVHLLQAERQNKKKRISSVLRYDQFLYKFSSVLYVLSAAMDYMRSLEGELLYLTSPRSTSMSPPPSLSCSL